MNEPGKVAQLDAEIAALNRKRNELVTIDSPRIIEVTAVMPVYNAWMWLGRSIFCLEQGAQSVPINMIMCDNSSTDPCKEILTSQGFKNWMERRGGIGDVEILPAVPQMLEDEFGTPENPIRRPFPNATVKKMRNVDFMLTKLTRHVKTEFTLYLDDDVGMPSGAVGVLLQKMKENKNLAMLGINYSNGSHGDHVQIGCTMARTQLMKEVVGQFDSRIRGCPCRDATVKLKESGYDVAYLPGWVARHFRNEMP